MVPASLRRIASLSGFCVCPGNVLFPGLPLVKINVIPRYAASSSSFSGVPPRVMVPAFCFGDRVNKVVEDLSLLTATHHFSVQLLSLPAANCILYVAVVVYSSLHHITKSSAYNAALMSFGSSETRSLNELQERPRGAQRWSHALRVDADQTTRKLCFRGLGTREHFSLNKLCKLTDHSTGVIWRD